MGRLTFNPVAHKYFYDGVEVPGVSRVLESVGISDFSFVPADVLIEAQELGKDVHEMLRLWDTDDPFRAAAIGVDPGYLAQWTAFKDDMGFKMQSFDLIETPLYSQVHKFAGTPDRIFITKKRPFVLYVIDIKTGTNTKSWQIQTAAYADLAVSNFHFTGLIKRMSVQLDPERGENGYKKYEYKDRCDAIVFQSALNVHRYKN